MSKDVKKAFGEALKQLRLEHDISQEKFALQISMDRSYYASVEAGKRNISIENIEKISNGYHISISELFSRMEDLSNNRGNNSLE